MRPSRLVLLVAPLLFIATARAEPPPAAAPATTSPPEPPREDDPLLSPVPAPAHVVSSWSDAVGILRSRSSDLRIALDEIDRAQGALRQTLATSLPVLTGSANVTKNVLRKELCTPLGLCSDEPIPDAYTYGASVTLTQPLISPRTWHAAKTARMGVDAARLSAEDQARLLAIGLANSIVSVVTAERLSELNRSGLRAALERLALARRRSALGAANALDVVRADQDVATARSAVVSGDETLRQAREALGIALGSSEAWGVPREINLDALEASARATCGVAETLDDRADVAAARVNSEIAKRGVDDVWLQFSPTVNVVSVFSASSVPFPNQIHEAWTIAGVLTVPFFDGGARYGALHATRAELDQAVQRLEAARRGASVQVTQAKRGVEVAAESLKVAGDARDLARETERLSRVAFQVGSGTSLDLIESGRQLRAAEIQLALSEFKLVQARIGALLALSRCRW
jgi:outer membrane protein, multidrug efflux system